MPQSTCVYISSCFSILLSATISPCDQSYIVPSHYLRKALGFIHSESLEWDPSNSSLFPCPRRTTQLLQSLVLIATQHSQILKTFLKARNLTTAHHQPRAFVIVLQIWILNIVRLLGWRINAAAPWYQVLQLQGRRQGENRDLSAFLVRTFQDSSY